MTKGEARKKDRATYCRKCGRKLIDMIIPSVKTGKYDACTGEPAMTKERRGKECPTHTCGHDSTINGNDSGKIPHGPWKSKWFSGDAICLKCGYIYMIRDI